MTTIRVLPQTGVGNSTVVAQMYSLAAKAQLEAQALKDQKAADNMQLKYEQALWQEKLKTTQLASALQYGAVGQSGYGVAAYGAPIGSPYVGVPAVAAGAYAASMVPVAAGMAAPPGTAQVASAGSSQTVANTYNVYGSGTASPYAAYGYPYATQSPGVLGSIGGWLSNLFQGW